MGVRTCASVHELGEARPPDGTLAAGPADLQAFDSLAPQYALPTHPLPHPLLAQAAPGISTAGLATAFQVRAIAAVLLLMGPIVGAHCWAHTVQPVLHAGPAACNKARRAAPLWPAQLLAVPALLVQ